MKVACLFAVLLVALSASDTTGTSLKREGATHDLLSAASSETTDKVTVAAMSRKLKEENVQEFQKVLTIARVEESQVRARTCMRACVALTESRLSFFFARL